MYLSPKQNMTILYFRPELQSDEVILQIQDNVHEVLQQREQTESGRIQSWILTLSLSYVGVCKFV